MYYIQRAIESLNHAKNMFGKSGCRYADEMHTAARLIMLATLYTEGWNDETDRATRLAEGFLAKIKSGDVIDAANGRLHVLSPAQLETIKHNAIERYKLEQDNLPVMDHAPADSDIAPDGEGSGVGVSAPGIGHTGAV